MRRVSRLKELSKSFSLTGSALKISLIELSLTIYLHEVVRLMKSDTQEH